MAEDITATITAIAKANKELIDSIETQQAEQLTAVSYVLVGEIWYRLQARPQKLHGMDNQYAL